jgi:hypothetical protein
VGRNKVARGGPGKSHDDARRKLLCDNGEMFRHDALEAEFQQG